MEFPNKIEGEIVDLVDLSITYLSDFHEYSVMPDLYTFLEFEPFINIDETSNYLKKLIKRSKNNDCKYWFIKLKSEQKVVGTIGVLNVDVIRKSLEIGYGVSPRYWGKGIFSNSCQLVLDYVFNKIMFHKVSAITDKRNFNSIKALKKLGFKLEGNLRDYYFYRGKGWIDASLLSILKKEYLDQYI